jgi:hypothetical protein
MFDDVFNDKWPWSCGLQNCATFIVDATIFLDDEPSTFKAFGARIVGWQCGAKLKGG